MTFRDVEMLVPKIRFALRKLSFIRLSWLELPQFGPDFIDTMYLALSFSNSKSIPSADDLLAP